MFESDKSHSTECRIITIGWHSASYTRVSGSHMRLVGRHTLTDASYLQLDNYIQVVLVEYVLKGTFGPKRLTGR